MNKTLIILLLLLVVSPGCALQDHYLSFPVTQLVYEELDMNLILFAEPCFICAAYGIMIGLDLVAGIYTFPHDICLFISRLVSGSRRRVSYEELPRLLRDQIKKED